MPGPFRSPEYFYFYNVVKQHLILASAWILFCVLHSFLASTSLKQWLAKKMGTGFQYYRLYYTLFASVSFIAVIAYQVFIPSPFIFSPSLSSYILGAITGISGLAIMAICIKKYFLSLSGLKTLLMNEGDASGNQLIVTGIHRYVRHPLYSGTFLFIWGLFIFLPHTSLLISNFIITVYTLIGIKFEEQKLIREFGPSYEAYRKKVPKIIPSLKSSPAN
jgi:protein-S-isoprenylcysteine O-methyltransferase Ste14